MSTVETRWGSGANAEAIAAWDGPLYDRFVRFREIVTTGLGAHGEAALELVPPRTGQRVLDVGCGFGDTTQRIAELVGPTGEAMGVGGRCGGTLLTRFPAFPLPLRHLMPPTPTRVPDAARPLARGRSPMLWRRS